MIHSAKESQAEFLLRKIHNSVKEIEEAVEKLEKLSEGQQVIVHCNECAKRNLVTCPFAEPPNDGYCFMARRKNDRNCRKTPTTAD